MEKQEKFMFYENFLAAIDALPEEQRAKACYEFCKYGITGVLPDDVYIRFFCIGVSASVQKYTGRGGNNNPTGKNQYTGKEVKEVKEVKTGQNGQYGRNGQYEQTETETKTETETEAETETESFSLKENTKRKVVRFKKPTVAEIAAYCQQRQNGIDAEQFYAYYESKGWKIGRNTPMKDWKFAVITWEKHKQKNTFSKPTNSLTDEDDGRMSPEQEEAFWNAWNTEAEKIRIEAMQQQKEGEK